MKKHQRPFSRLFLFGLAVTCIGIAASPDTTNAPSSSTNLQEQIVSAAPDNQPSATEGKVYILPIRGPIEPALLYVVRRGLAEARSENVSAVVFPMDTPGGAVNITEKIVELIVRMDVPTYTYVENNAISAGAIIALSTDKIYMAPGSKIGDAMPIMMAPGGGVQPLPDAEREKIMSYVDSMVRGVAQRKGRDETLASAMVRPEIEYIVDGEVISKEGQLLTLTNVEAERRYGDDQLPLLSEGTVDGLDVFLADTLGFAPGQRVELVVTSAERLARFLQMIGPLLMMVGFMGIYLEFQSPGFGVPGIVGAICLVLFFLGHHIAGLAGNEVILLFLLGCSLIFIELFVLPGFGLIGLTGLILILWSLLNAMVERFPGDPWIPNLSSLQWPMLKLASSIIGATIGAAVLGRYLPQSNTFKNRLVLNESTSREAGYTSNQPRADLIGQEGVTLSALYPAGTAMIGDTRVDVVSEGDYIDQGSKIRVVKTHGYRVVVEKINESADKA
jgi:membrane-bound serine protease (ClpP class)